VLQTIPNDNKKLSGSPFEQHRSKPRRSDYTHLLQQTSQTALCWLLPPRLCCDKRNLQWE